MEAERKRERKEHQVSERKTRKNILDRKRKEAAEARLKDPALMSLYSLFFPTYRERGRPKYITDKYGNRVRSGMEEK